MKPKAVILLSGGLDSATTLAIASHEGYEPYALSFAYGQRHACELAAAKKIAAAFCVTKHLVVSLDLRAIGGSALTSEISVPHHEIIEETNQQSIPVTYVPARNTIFLSYALAWAEVLCTPHIFIGVNAVDYSGYPDCRPEFIDAFMHMSRYATRMGVEQNLQIHIHTPLISMTKAEIIQKGHTLGVDFSLTHSCYSPTEDDRPCGKCDSCLFRKKGFEEAGLEDPLLSL